VARSARSFSRRRNDEQRKAGATGGTKQRYLDGSARRRRDEDVQLCVALLTAIKSPKERLGSNVAAM
jgi:hypothetical protein